MQDTLVKIAKKLKKNSVAVDVVSFGCEAENDEKLSAFHEAVNSNGNSHLVSVWGASGKFFQVCYVVGKTHHLSPCFQAVGWLLKTC